ncbi:hypothetical protein E5E97_16185 [Aeromonas sp. 2692-1]|uniref:hypothetical protein n=1 Tax=Aeromonas TaxID=642 RepID=UPI00148B0BF6|nr:hypothetical protein [Aeromonas sp. 2692-1]QJT14294.1 hypothetical protein E5E97_16075 [Aeromonas sp. 2692-1]QJT14304.1 hypothetical protein E5E97_16130 [Aeromonas sp. 2692-1]QJT14314.1 hypothetical protein E5E97_16185 [Aeromonas sp. 2692-1]
MVDMLSKYAKYVFSNKKEGFILLAQWGLAATLAYLAPKWEVHPIIAAMALASTMVLILVQRIGEMFKKLIADK